MKYKKILMITLITSLGTSFSCKKFVQLDPPINSIVPANVYKSDDLATSAMLGIYQQMAATDYASGDNASISTLCGLTADEFIGHNADLLPFYQNLMIPEISKLSSIWDKPYRRIYDANSMLEGLETEGGISPQVKNQLRGEALFVRAFNYFYLVNLYGPVPLYLNSDFQSNSKARRASINDVYMRVIEDLKAAEGLINDDYISTERVRPNKAAVQAMLARSYLYLRDWKNAEKSADMVISKTGTYKLVGLDQIFLKNSLEAIWQLMPAPSTNTPAGSLFILTTAPTQVSLRPDFVINSFEANDQRKTAWVKSIIVGGGTYYYPYKYKVRSSTTVTEYSMVLRLAEQYLIRAEARAEQGNLLGAIEDLDAIRNRAGLLLLKNTNPGISRENLLDAILKERKVELFSEWGDRWFELKRTLKINAMLTQVKPGWKSSYALFPIPISEINNNPNVTQNDGY